MVFQESSNGVWSLKSVSMNLKGCFNEVLRLFTESLKGVSWSLKGVSRKFKGCFREVSGKFQGGFKNVSRKIEGHLKVVFKGV